MPLYFRFAWASAFLIGAALFYAPLAYGCTRPDMLPTLYALLGLAIVTGVISMFLRGGWPAVPRTTRACMGLLLVQGWWLTFSPTFPAIQVDTGGLVDTSLENIQRLSRDSMVMITLMFGTFAVLCDLYTEAILRRFILLAAAISGVLICVVGIALKLTGEPLMRYVWKPVDIYWNDFAFFRYHGNAGAFLNLVWPLILVFARRSYGQEVFLGKRIVWTVAAVACGAALFLNASKAGLAIGLLILPWPFSSGLKQLSSKTLFIIGLCVVLGLATILFATSQIAHEAAFKRMTESTELTSSFNGRWAAYKEFMEAVPAAGAFGLGPGLFQLAFPYQTSPLGNIAQGMREFAHEDYLQTVLEWGWLGTIWWTIFVVGGIFRALRIYSKRERFGSRTERHLVLAAVLGVLGTLTESLFDFPLQVASLRLFFLVLLALCWNSHRLLAPPQKDPNRVRYRLPIPADVSELTTSSRGR